MSDTVSRSRAIRRLLKLVRPQEAVLATPHEAVGLVARNDISALCDIPEQACSLRDGYALRSEDVANAGPMAPVTLNVTHTVRAESLTTRPVEPCAAARVLTGGMVPPCADAVLAEEDVEEDDGTIRVITPVRPGWFVRPVGGDLEKDSVILSAGQVVTPQAAAVMARSRVASILVDPRPTVEVLALGSELSDPICCGEECDGARFPADNLVLLDGLLRASGADVAQTGVLPDSEQQLVKALSRTDLPDIVITTGGTGRSERDFARASAKEAGFAMVFDHVDIRPGRNMFAAHRGGTLLFCLPGPPAAVYACFHAVVLAMVRRMRGLPDDGPLVGRLERGVSAKPGGEWLVLCMLAHAEGRLVVTPLTGKHSPPMLSMAHAHGMVVVPGGGAVLPDGEVEVLTTLF